MYKTYSLGRTYFLTSLAAVFLFIILFSSFLAYNEYRDFTAKSDAVDEKLLKEGKENLQTMTYKVATFLENEQGLAEEKLKTQVRSRLDQGFGFIENIHGKYGKTEPREKVIRRITETFSEFTFGADSYFFIFDKNFRQIQGDFGLPEHVNLSEIKDYRGRYVVREIKETAMKGGGFVTYQWKKPGVNDFSYGKISYVRYFEPYGLIIGTGGYVQDVAEEVKREALQRIEHLVSSEKAFFYILDGSGNMLSHSEKDLIGKNINEIDNPVKRDSLKEILTFAENSREGYHGFDWIREDAETPSSMASYNLKYPEWNWVIGFAIYLEDVRKIIDQGKHELQVSLLQSMAIVGLTFLIVFAAAYLIAKRFSGKLEGEFSKFLDFFSGAAEKGAEIDADSMNYEEFRQLALYANRMNYENRRKTLELEKATAAARKASSTKSELISHISHELRTPLTGVLGFIELLDGTELDKIQKRFLRIIKHSSSNLVGVVNDILDFSKLETGSLVLNYDRFSPLSTFESMSELFGFMASESGMEFALYMDHSIPCELEGDVVRISQILSNLVENAVKFNAPGGCAMLDITAVRRNENAVRLRFSVEDNGIGVSDEKQTELEKLFSEYDTEIAERFEGLGGIGLSVSSDIVKLMHGEIGFYRAEKQGSVFWFELDFRVINAKPSVDAARVSDCYSAVFINDDMGDPGVTESQIMRCLKAFGNEVSYFSSLDDIEKLPFLDVVFYVYSENTKDKFLESIRTHEGVPIVLIMDIHRRFEEEDLRKRASSVLFKPIGLSDIYESVYIATSYMNDEPIRDEKQNGRTGGFKGTALVAEDNPVNQKMVRLILKELGLESVCVDNGRKAVEAFRQGGFDIVIMDINMPELGGIEAAKLINEYEKANFFKHVPVIALTAYAIKGDRERFIEAGMDDYLAKPVSIDIMRETLQKHLKVGNG
ncbi:response regulator [Geovibrio thiophilus]|uniref:histidine kinase n=1 Tax=Geovibrio thiophilus TaxID=139438 RepID=A0A410JWK6_9BACT|nr:cache domain-containing protein [Geovibrio thiophilus]QAR32415.1 response regulator [Geovibrio thiophilus]